MDFYKPNFNQYAPPPPVLNLSSKYHSYSPSLQTMNAQQQFRGVTNYIDSGMPHKPATQAELQMQYEQQIRDALREETQIRDNTKYESPKLPGKRMKGEKMRSSKVQKIESPQMMQPWKTTSGSRTSHFSEMIVWRWHHIDDGFQYPFAPDNSQPFLHTVVRSSPSQTSYWSS